MPDSWNDKTKPHLFCPGCGHAIALKQLGYVIDDLGIQDKTTFGIDIGCSLLAWNFLDVDTIQTHHGRTTAVMVGYKRVRPERVGIAYMGDGGGYAIGLQYILHAAFRNEPVTVVVVNNENYAMTGGQCSPTSPCDMVTSTSPHRTSTTPTTGFHGPELVRNIAHTDAFITRVSLSNPISVRNAFKKALEHQINNKSFSMIEVLSICPTNWKTNAKDSFAKLGEIEKIYVPGEVK